MLSAHHNTAALTMLHTKGLILAVVFIRNQFEILERSDDGWLVGLFSEILTFARKAARKENSDDNNSFRINQLGMVHVMLCCVLCCPPRGFCADV